MSRTGPCFNSTLVLLKELAAVKAAFAVLSFNSTLVLLKADRLPLSAFQLGGFNSTLVLLKVCLAHHAPPADRSFNSTLVLLKEVQRDQVPDALGIFFVLFQFHTGSTKRLIFFSTQSTPPACFNSTLVLLKGAGVAPGPDRARQQVSIPHWFY